jgi:hypothetical protein
MDGYELRGEVEKKRNLRHAVVHCDFRPRRQEDDAPDDFDQYSNQSMLAPY